MKIKPKKATGKKAKKPNQKKVVKSQKQGKVKNSKVSEKSYIEQYVDYLHKHPKRANKKILAVYEKLKYDVKHKNIVQYVNRDTGEVEKKVYVFDIKKAHRPIYFIENYCKHSKGKWAGKPIKLELFQKAMIEASYGFVDDNTGNRKYKKVVNFVAKKNGKSTLGAGLGLYGLIADGEGGAEIYSIAKVKDQAKAIWLEAKNMAKKSPELNKLIRPTISGLFYDNRDAFFMPLASETNSLDGKNVHYCLADEIWAWEDDGLLDIMQDGMSAREQPLMLEFSTMGNVRGKVFDTEYEYCEKIIKGYLGQEGGIVDETILPIIYELDSIDEWQDEECWYKANPNLNVSKSLDYMRDKVIKAKNDPIALSNLLCKDFNVRQTSSSAWLTYEELNNELTYTDDEFRDCYCIGGCDLSSTTDLTCATLLGIKNGQMYCKQMYWLPEDYLMERVNQDKIPYDKWKMAGWLRTSAGSKVSYSDITEWFVEQAQKLDLRPLWLGYDRWSAQYWCDEMKGYGFDMVEVRQGAKTMSQPMKVMKALLNEKAINYNNNPILKWCLSNMSVKSDSNENIQPIKDNQRQRIDGAVSLIDAMVVYCENQHDYENYVK